MREDQDEAWLPTLEADTFAELVDDLCVVAFYDRNSLDALWRAVFLVRTGESVHLFDVNGDPIDEKDSPGGVQALSAFLNDYLAGYYKAARVSAELHPEGSSHEDEALDGKNGASPCHRIRSAYFLLLTLLTYL